MRRSLTWLGFLTTLTLLLAACGGDDALSDEAYFAALHDWEAAAEAQGSAVAEPSPDDDAEAIAAFFDSIQAVFVDARAGLAALAPPAALTPAHDAFVDATDGLIDTLERVRSGGAEAWTDVVSFYTEADGAFDAFFRACARLQGLAIDRGAPVLSCEDGRDST